MRGRRGCARSIRGPGRAGPAGGRARCDGRPPGAAGRPWPPGSPCPPPARGARGRRRRRGGRPCARPARSATTRGARPPRATRRGAPPAAAGSTRAWPGGRRCGVPGARRARGTEKAKSARANPLSRRRDRPRLEPPHEEARAHHRHHRPGRLVPGRVAVGQGLRGDRHGAPHQHRELRAHRPHPGPHHLRPGRPARRGLADPGAARAPARGGVQPGGPSPSCRPRSANRCSPARPPRWVSPACSTPCASSTRRPLLPGVVERDVRQGRGGPPARDHAALPPQPLRRGQGLRPLDHHQLPRVLRPPRLFVVRACCSTTRAPAAAWSS